MITELNDDTYIIANVSNRINELHKNHPSIFDFGIIESAKTNNQIEGIFMLGKGRYCQVYKIKALRRRDRFQ